MKRSLFLVYLLASLSAFAVAQGNGGNAGGNAETPAPPAQTPAAPAKPTPTPDELPPLPKPEEEGEEEEPKSSSKEEKPTKTSDAPQKSDDPKKPDAAPPKITNSGEAAGDDDDLPSVSESTKPAATIIGGGTPAGDDEAIGPLPTLQRVIPTYPPAAVPNTNGAPFMQRSTLPEGTVFICVGSALAFLALCIFIWRGIVAWALHRSVQKASRAPGLIESGKGGLRAGGPLQKPSHASFYSAAPAGSTLSLNPLNPSSARKGSTSMPMTSPGRNHTPNASLFFSPTAATNGSIPGADNRRSAYLPAGYYPTATPTIPPGPHHFHTASISSSNLGRFREPSPPGSPMLTPDAGRQGSQGRTSVYERSSVYGGQSLRPADSHTSLNLPPQGRAPSAYLEDLFEGNILDHPTAGQGGSYNNRR